MMEIQKFYSELYNLYGNVTRARNCFLYTEKGVRLTDLYQENGRAILGWGGNQYTVFKNIISRGINGTFKTCFEPQLDKAAGTLFGGKRKVFAFSSYLEAQMAAGTLFPESSGGWKPFCPETSFPNVSMPDAVYFIPPFAWSENLYLVAVKADSERNLLEELCSKNLYPVTLPPPLCSAFARALYDVIKAEKAREEKHFFLYDKVLSKYFTRKGPWLTPKVPEEKYGAFVLHCLAHGIVINPEYRDSIIPFGADPGVFSQLSKNPFSC